MTNMQNWSGACNAQQNQLSQLGQQFGAPGGACPGGWSPMDTAPRDGTTIEIRCTYGVAPWYGLFRWTDEMVCEQDGKQHVLHGQPRWAGVPDDRVGFSEDQTFSWRAYGGNVQYVDPTGGQQNDPAYWRAVAAAKYGLPADHFEERPHGWLRKLFG